MKPSINSELLESKMVLAGYRTRKSFADALQVAEHSVSNLLNGVYNPSYELMNKIYQQINLFKKECMPNFQAAVDMHNWNVLCHS